MTKLIAAALAVVALSGCSSEPAGETATINVNSCESMKSKIIQLYDSATAGNTADAYAYYQLKCGKDGE